MEFGESSTITPTLSTILSFVCFLSWVASARICPKKYYLLQNAKVNLRINQVQSTHIEYQMHFKMEILLPALHIFMLFLDILERVPKSLSDDMFLVSGNIFYYHTAKKHTLHCCSDLQNTA